MTNFDRILSEARELLTEEERRKLSLELVQDMKDDSEAEERAALEAAIEEGFEDFEKGNYSDAREFAKQLRLREIPARELWLRQNEEALASVKRGLAPRPAGNHRRHLDLSTLPDDDN